MQAGTAIPAALIIRPNINIKTAIAIKIIGHPVNLSNQGWKSGTRRTANNKPPAKINNKPPKILDRLEELILAS
jgi:hypothetical protein